MLYASAGQGTLSKALLAHPNVERVIAVEHMKRYIPDVQVGPDHSGHLGILEREILNLVTAIGRNERRASEPYSSRSFLVGHLRRDERARPARSY